jgi:hypothetical protein
MFIVLYRWKIKPVREMQFISAWSEITAYYLENLGSLGSRLHRGSDGLFYAYAQWKSAEDRERAFAGAGASDAAVRMTDAVAERFEPVILEKIADYLVDPPE